MDLHLKNTGLRNFLVDFRPGVPLKKVLPILVGLFLMNSCTTKPAEKKLSEGEIEYQIEYLDDERENPFIMLLPRKMTTSFNKTSSNTLIEGFFGTFKLTYILNAAEKKNYSLLQIMDKKYVYQADINNLAFGYKTMQNLELEFTGKEKIIAGFNCKHATAHLNSESNESIDIYYTEEIDLQSPNLNNPYKKIDGVLMEFSANMVGINMKFTTTKVTNKKIDGKLFEIPNGFTKISLNEMEKFVADFHISSNK